MTCVHVHYFYAEFAEWLDLFNAIAMPTDVARVAMTIYSRRSERILHTLFCLYRGLCPLLSCFDPLPLQL